MYDWRIEKDNTIVLFGRTNSMVADLVARINYGAEILSKYNLDGMWFINGGMINNDKVFWFSQLMYLYDNNYLDKFLIVFKPFRNRN